MSLCGKTGTHRLTKLHKQYEYSNMNIVITLPVFLKGEENRIVDMLESGKADLIHIRKPDASREATESLLLHLPKWVYGRLVLHDHHDLAVEYGLYGIHLNSRHPQTLEGWQGSVSKSCHSIDELVRCKQESYHYLSLSPIFDSISKPGYCSAFSKEELMEAYEAGIIDSRVMALGGVTFERIEQVRKMGFGGAMILGDAWK